MVSLVLRQYMRVGNGIESLVDYRKISQIEKCKNELYKMS